MNTDHVLEDLANDEQQAGNGKVDYRMWVSEGSSRISKSVHTHRPEFAKHPQNQHCFEDVE